MATKLDEYINLDLTLIRYTKTSAMCTSRIMWCIGNDTNALRWYKWQGRGIEAEVKIVVGNWNMQWLEGLIAPNRKLELNK